MPEIKCPVVCGDKIGMGESAIEANFEYSDAIPVNMIAVIRESMGNSGFLLSHDGLKNRGNGTGVDRGALYNERWKRYFRVMGNSFIEINSNYTTTNIGTISGSGKVSIAYSFQSVMIVADNKAWRYDGTTFAQLTDPDLGYPTDVTWIDSYYVFTDGEYIFHTDIGDETSIDPLKFATSELSPDPTKAVTRTQDDLLMVFNRYTIEFFINTASPNFAFSRLNQKAMSCGVIGTYCWSELDGNMFILGGRKEENPSVHIVGAGVVTSVATRYIDRVLGLYTEDELSLAVLGSRITNRDKLLYVYLPRHVLVYNHTVAQSIGTNNAWTMLKSPGNTKWSAINGVYNPIVNKWIFGDASTAYIYTLDPTSAKQSDQPVEQEFYSPLVPIDSMSVDEVQVNVVSGEQLASVYMFISETRDGYSYTTEWSRTVASPEVYYLNCIFRRLGYVRTRIGFKFRTLTTEKINVGGMVIRYG